MYSKNIIIKEISSLALECNNISEKLYSIITDEFKDKFDILINNNTNNQGINCHNIFTEKILNNIHTYFSKITDDDLLNRVCIPGKTLSEIRTHLNNIKEIFISFNTSYITDESKLTNFLSINLTNHNSPFNSLIKTLTDGEIFQSFENQINIINIQKLETLLSENMALQKDIVNTKEDVLKLNSKNILTDTISETKEIITNAKESLKNWTSAIMSVLILSVFIELSLAGYLIINKLSLFNLIATMPIIALIIYCKIKEFAQEKIINTYSRILIKQIALKDNQLIISKISDNNYEQAISFINTNYSATFDEPDTLKSFEKISTIISKTISPITNTVSSLIHKDK